MMRWLPITFCLLLYFGGLLGQNTRWRDHFSYFNVKQILPVGANLVCATEGGLFTYNPSTGDLKKNSKVNGLTDINISAIGYSSIHQMLLIGYESGILDIQDANGTEINVDIPIDTDFQGNKRINHIFVSGNFAVISMNFGVLYFDLINREFLETIYFRSGATFYPVRKSVIYNNTIYAAASNGLYSHPINVTLPDISTWTVQYPGFNFQHIALSGTNLYASSGDQVFQSINGGPFIPNAVFSGIRDIFGVDNQLYLTQNQSVTIFDANFNQIQQQSFTPLLNTGILFSGQIFGGSQEKGLITATEENICPAGPFKNLSVAVSALNDKIWICPGGLDSFFIPNGNNNGFFHFNGTDWKHYTSASMGNALNFLDAFPNPENPNEFYAVSYGTGVFHYTSETSYTLYNNGNSALQPLHFITGGCFDSKGNIYFSQGFTGSGFDENSIVVRTGSSLWLHKSLSLVNIAPQAALRRPSVDRNGWVYAPGPRGDGLAIWNPKNTLTNLSDDELYVVSTASNQGNLPTNEVLVATPDLNGNIWIGTTKGLRVLSNPRTRVPSGDFQTSRIVIVQNGLAEELLRDIQINAIAVDRANRKWIATEGSGVFYVSENGQTVFHAFNRVNSPLPDNNVKDISIDYATGWVYFATPSGTVSYRSDVTTAGEDFEEVIPYPNPVRPGYEGFVVVRGLADDVLVKIIDAAGNMVFRTRARGGVFEWNQRNLQGKLVGTGVYTILMTTPDGQKTAVAKLAIVR